MSTYQNLRLHDWIEIAKQSDQIQDVRTVVLAYCMDEHEAMAWIADIVEGRISEQEAQVFMERVLQNKHHLACPISAASRPVTVQPESLPVG